MRRFILILLVGCLSAYSLEAQTKKEKKQMKAEEEARMFEKTKELIDSKDFEFTADWASSFQGKRVNLIGNPNYLYIIGDSASIRLPYYGVANNASMAYRGDVGVTFNGIMKEYEVKVNDKKQQVAVSFKAASDKENLDVLLTIFSSGNTRINLSSNVRQGMKYDGKISPSSRSNPEQ